MSFWYVDALHVKEDIPAKLTDVRNISCSSCGGCANHDDVVGEDQVGKVLTVYADSFLILVDLTDDDILEVDCD